MQANMNITKRYVKNFKNILSAKDFENKIDQAYNIILETLKADKKIYICGNGGSAANAIHIANDFLLGVIGKFNKKGIKIEALTANSSVLTCLANDLSYAKIFSEQIKTKGSENDLLISCDRKINLPGFIGTNFVFCCISNAHSIGAGYSVTAKRGSCFNI